MVFGRPATDIEQAGAARRGKTGGVANVDPSPAPGNKKARGDQDACSTLGLARSPTRVKAERARTMAMKESGFKWVHRRNRDYLRVQQFRLAKRKLRAAAYSHEGVNYKKLFHFYDRHNTGSLDVNEFLSALRRDAKQSKSKRGWSDKMIVDIFRMIDKDESGTIEYNEFVEWLSEDNSDAFLDATSSGAKDSRSDSDHRNSSLRDHPRLSTAYMLTRRMRKQQQRHRFREIQGGLLERQRDELVNQWHASQHVQTNRVVDYHRVVDRLYPFPRSKDTQFDVNKEIARRRRRGDRNYGRRKRISKT